MKEIRTEYGILPGSGNEEYDREGRLRGIVVTGRVSIDTGVGVLVPAWRNNTVRRKYRNSLTFWPDGKLRSIYLEERTLVTTPIGTLPAELITWYENGQICRVFPSYGQISAFWSEEDEFLQTPEITVPVRIEEAEQAAGVSCRAADLCFGQEGKLESVTLMPGGIVSVPVGRREVMTDFGFDLYEDGRVKSIEPCRGTEIETPAGVLFPFRGWRVKFHAEDNSVAFDRVGRVCEVRTQYGTVPIPLAEEQNLTLQRKVRSVRRTGTDGSKE